MDPKSKINIVSNALTECSSNIKVDNITYHVQTEDMGRKTSKIVSKVFLKGEVVFSKKTDYSHLTKLKNYEAKLKSIMEKQHNSTIDYFVAERSTKEKLKAEYFEEFQMLLRRGNGASALNVLKIALDKYPNDPFLLSYYGCLLAIVENKAKEGVKICENAIKHLDKSMPFGSEFFYPAFYLNLGRAHLKNNNIKDAVTALHTGLSIDSNNRDIIWELKKMGVRKKPVVPFLGRNNPINKYIGKLRSKVTKS